RTITADGEGLGRVQVYFPTNDGAVSNCGGSCLCVITGLNRHVGRTTDGGFAVSEAEGEVLTRLVDGLQLAVVVADSDVQLAGVVAQLLKQLLLVGSAQNIDAFFAHGQLEGTGSAGSQSRAVEGDNGTSSS